MKTQKCSGVRADDKKLKELGFDDRGKLRIGPKLYAFTLMESALELWHVGRLPEAVAAHRKALKDEAVKESRYDHAKEHRRLAEVYLMMGRAPARADPRDQGSGDRESRRHVSRL